MIVIIGISDQPCWLAEACKLLLLLQDGLVSNWMFNNMRPGKTIAFKGVDGDFTLGLAATTPHSRVLLVAAGIGITPMRVLLSERLSQQQPVSLLYFVRTLREAPFLQELVQVCTLSCLYSPCLNTDRVMYKREDLLPCLCL